MLLEVKNLNKSFQINNKKTKILNDISFSVDCDKIAYDSCLSRGAKGVDEPHFINDLDGKWGRSSIKTYGDTVHSFIHDVVNKRIEHLNDKTYLEINENTIKYLI